MVARHWFLFEMPWHSDGVHALDDPVSLYICDSPGERRGLEIRLRRLGRLTVEAGSLEARTYMSNAVRVMAPDVWRDRCRPPVPVHELVEAFREVCCGHVPLFD